MFRELSERITERLLANEVILREDQEIYRYGIQQGMISLINLGTTFIIGMVFGMFLESILFMVAYMPLRRFAGGYHAKTALRCYFFSIVMMITIFWVIRSISFSNLICSCLMILSGIIIFILAPVEDRNKPLDDLERVVYRKCTRNILLSESVFWCVSLLLEWKCITACMTMVLCFMAFMLLLHKNAFGDERITYNSK